MESPFFIPKPNGAQAPYSVVEVEEATPKAAPAVTTNDVVALRDLFVEVVGGAIEEAKAKATADAKPDFQPKQCVVCSKWFEPNSGRHMLCSDPCREDWAEISLKLDHQKKQYLRHARLRRLHS